jgi:hypothetical protein
MTPRELQALRRRWRKLGVPSLCIHTHMQRTLKAKAERERRHAEFMAKKAAPFRSVRPAYTRHGPLRPPENCVVCGTILTTRRRRTCSEPCMKAARGHVRR